MVRTHLTLVFLTTLLACGNYARIGPVRFPTNAPTEPTPAMTFHDLSATDIHGAPVEMSRYAGKKVLVVNTASECGFTPQYQQLQELYEAYADQGLVIIGFPSNDFGGQEPGTEEDIAAFCTKEFGVTFPMMRKVKTTGPDQHLVFAWLTKRTLNGKLDVEMDWNFRKFLIDEQGMLVTTLAPATSPLDPIVLDWLAGER